MPTLVRQTTKAVFNFDAVGLMNIARDMNEENFQAAPITYGGAQSLPLCVLKENPETLIRPRPILLRSAPRPSLFHHLPLPAAQAPPQSASFPAGN